MKRAYLFLIVTLLMRGQVSAFAQVTAVPHLMNFQGRPQSPTARRFLIRSLFAQLAASASEPHSQRQTPRQQRDQ
jgi:hypothetical protein